MLHSCLGDRYDLERLLGESPGRLTFLARDRAADRAVVVKLLRFGQGTRWEDLQRCEREAQTLAALEHPAIPKLLDHFEVQRADFRGFAWVQDYVTGASLRACLAAGERFSPSEVMQLARQVLEILDYLHGRSPPVIHRDIKPANLLIQRDSGAIARVFLVDFGGVQVLGGGQTRTVVGSYGYMPLEQFGGRSVPASDLYALGATLIEVLTGVHPADLPQVDFRLDFGQGVPLALGWRTWLERMTAPQASDRFLSAREALAALDRLDAGQTLGDALALPSGRVGLRETGRSRALTLRPAPPKVWLGVGVPFVLAWDILLASIVPTAIAQSPLHQAILAGFFLPFALAGGAMTLGLLLLVLGHLHLEVTPDQLIWEYRLGRWACFRRRWRRQELEAVEWRSPGVETREGVPVQVPATVILCTPRQRHPLTTGLNLSADEARWLAETLGQSLQLPLRSLTPEPAPPP